MLQGALLGLIHIGHDSSCRNHPGGVVVQPQTGEGAHLKVFPQDLPAGLVPEEVAVQGGNRHIVAVFQLINVHPRHVKGVVADDLRRRKLIDLIKKLPAGVNLRHQELPGRDIRCGNSVLSIHVHNAHEVVVLRLIQSLGAGDGARGHHPDHLPLHQPLGQLGILHLLRDGHLVAVLDQAVEIGVHRMVGHAAHGRPLRQAALLPGQRDLQNL